ncbi:MAG: type II restriction endonuclease [Methanobrevibacter sp.]|nr:type II restriction endonuclease [Methanobrevibacter sp.]
MVYYEKLGYKSFEEYTLDYDDSLLTTNRTYEFFVDWEKVFGNLENKVVEINILNSLNKIGSDKVEDKFIEILKKYPECVPILPLVLAIRDKKVDVIDLTTQTFKKIDFSMNNFKLDEVLTFSRKTGLLNLFNEIDDLYSYLTGTEVGLDTNARKNRSGHVFEGIVGDLLEKSIENNPQYSLTSEDSSIKTKRNKRADFVIYKDDIPLFLFECNFYSAGGSKPIETANAYIDLQKKISDLDMTFIWITDGQGWKKMFTTLKFAMRSIDYVLNYNMLKDNIDNILF